MKHIPILFSTPMVQALLEGRKTQTRRVVKTADIIFAPDKFTYIGNTNENQDIPHPAEGSNSKIWYQWRLKNNNSASWIDTCPYGQPGDILWVRESFNYGNIGNGMQPFYRADNERPHGYSTPWKPSIHMPKSACRLFLKVKSVRVERLQDISEEDAISEGIKPTGYFDFYENYLSEGYTDLVPYESFKSLWQSINSPASWEANPWVWVVEFERVERPGGFCGLAMTDKSQFNPGDHEQMK